MSLKRMLLATAALALAVAGPALGQLRAGDDGLATPGGGQTQFDLKSVPVQAVFGAPVDGSTLVSLRGRPFDPATLGPVDTILRRPQDIAFAGTNQASGPLQIVGLSLESEKAVSIGGQLYSLALHLSSFSQPVGSAALTRVNGDGGTFSSRVSVVPRLTFTNQADGSTVVIDCGAVSCDPYDLSISNVGWVQTGGPGHFDPRARGEVLLPAGAWVDTDGDGQANLQLLGSTNFFPGLTASTGFPESPFGISTRPIIIIIHWVRGPILLASTAQAR
jgi:hypothetical protein